LDFAIEQAVSDGNKASIAPPHRAGTVPDFLSRFAVIASWRQTSSVRNGFPSISGLKLLGWHTFLATDTKKIRIRKSFSGRGLRISFRGNCRFFPENQRPSCP
jgi:hypothetical protein